jgi:DNA-binding NtrC family response regulator
LYVVDARRVVLFFNRGCEELTGWSAGEVVGRACDYASEPQAAQLDALSCALCPPPEALQGRPVAVRVELPTRSTGLQSRTIVCTPLPDSDPLELRILCACLPAKAADELSNHVAALSPLHAELARLREDLATQFQLDQVIAAGPSMRRIVEQVQLAAGAPVGVHFHGPAGAGREFLARVVHQRSARRLRAFVPLDCDALPPFELKRTLRRALVPEPEHDAAGELLPGTILLRNVTRLPRDVQVWLLETGWGSGTAAADVALYSLDSVPLATATADDRLLSEMFHRLMTLTIDVPPLRERGSELPLLAQYFLERQNRHGDRQLSGFSREALERLQEYDWPGNVSELRKVVEESHSAAAGAQVELHELPFRFRTGLAAQRTAPRRNESSLDLDAYLREVEGREIRRVLEECRQNRAQAARRLGLTRTKLYRRMEQLGIAAPLADDPPPENIAAS